MAKLRKLWNNFNFRVFFALGIPYSIKYYFLVFRHITNILYSASLRNIDRAMGRTAIKNFRYQNKSICIRIKDIDNLIREDSFTFGLVREIFIRNCYFKHIQSIYRGGMGVVIDAGANRGIFSAMVTPIASRIICIELNSKYNESIESVMKSNQFSEYSIENCFLGDGGYDSLSAKEIPKLSMSDLFTKHSIDKVSLLKLDIEGSEFALFNNLDWLTKVEALTLEVHPEFGEVKFIHDALKVEGFCVITADENLKRIYPSQKTSFIYAYKNSTVG